MDNTYSELEYLHYILNQNKKVVRKFAALPPPGHEQWDQIPGNENMYDEGLEEQPIMAGIDTSIAHVQVRELKI